MRNLFLKGLLMLNQDIDRCGLVALRVYLCLQTFCMFGISPLDERSYIRTIADSAGNQGRAGTMFLAGLALIALADTIVNDVMADKYKFDTALRVRHYLLLGLTLGYGSFLYMCVMHAQAFTILPLLMLNISALLVATFADIHFRFGKKAERRKGIDRRKGEHHA